MSTRGQRQLNSSHRRDALYREINVFVSLYAIENGTKFGDKSHGYIILDKVEINTYLEKRVDIVRWTNRALTFKGANLWAESRIRNPKTMQLRIGRIAQQVRVCCYCKGHPKLGALSPSKNISFPSRVVHTSVPCDHGSGMVHTHWDTIHINERGVQASLAGF